LKTADLVGGAVLNNAGEMMFYEWEFLGWPLRMKGTPFYGGSSECRAARLAFLLLMSDGSIKGIAGR